LYKIQNRMASGSYFPPAVRTVFIPKKPKGSRPLGIPTVADRIAQGVVKDYLEPLLEPLFHSSSYGYRPGRSAHHALAQCQHYCNMFDWVIDLDIKGFFDNLSHEWIMKMVRHHTPEKWVLLYIERWLKAGVEQADGSIVGRTKGTPQGGVISPLLSNLYLHHIFDMWMGKYHWSNPFERYADDIVVHCKTKDEAELLMEAIRQRLLEFGLELHPDKTKLVYCKRYNRQEKHEHNSFTFLSYSFQPRGQASRIRRMKFMVFAAGICCSARTHIRQRIREVFNPRLIHVPLAAVAKKLNPKIRGWLNYYSLFTAERALKVFMYLNDLIQRWLKAKYKIRGKYALKEKYLAYEKANRAQFVHWQKGMKY
ncbi:MAG: group II intron reverse transcriptase/maturase, partial [Bacteroidota bacterium]